MLYINWSLFNYLLRLFMQSWSYSGKKNHKNSIKAIIRRQAFFPFKGNGNFSFTSCIILPINLLVAYYSRLECHRHKIQIFKWRKNIIFTRKRILANKNKLYMQACCRATHLHHHHNGTLVNRIYFN